MLFYTRVCKEEKRKLNMITSNRETVQSIHRLPIKNDLLWFIFFTLFYTSFYSKIPAKSHLWKVE